MGPRTSIVQGLARVFAECLSDPARLAAAAVQAQKHVFKYFTWEAKAGQMLEVYDWVRGRQMEKPDWGTPFGFPR
jgi:hypothetical protein